MGKGEEDSLPCFRFNWCSLDHFLSLKCCHLLPQWKVRSRMCQYLLSDLQEKLLCGYTRIIAVQYKCPQAAPNSCSQEMDRRDFGTSYLSQSPALKWRPSLSCLIMLWFCLSFGRLRLFHRWSGERPSWNHVNLLIGVIGSVKIKEKFETKEAVVVLHICLSVWNPSSNTHTHWEVLPVLVMQAFSSSLRKSEFPHQSDKKSPHLVEEFSLAKRVKPDNWHAHEL